MMIHNLWKDGKVVGIAKKLIGKNEYVMRVDGVYWRDGLPTKQGGTPATRVRRLKDAKKLVKEMEF